MRKFTKRLISAALCLCMVVGLIMQGGGIQSFATSLNEYLLGKEYQTGTTYKSNWKAQLGTEENPFVVLEIVPDLESAQFGYFIPGCEPADVEKLAAYSSLTKGDINSLFSDVYKVVEEPQYVLYEDLPTGDGFKYRVLLSSVAGEGYKTRTDLEYVSVDRDAWRQSYQRGDSDFKKAGYYEKVAEGTGYFKASHVSQYETNAFNMTDYKYAAFSGDSSVDANDKLTFEYVGEGKGNYKWVSSDATPDTTDTPTKDSEKVWATRNDLFYRNVVSYVHKDTFIKYVFEDFGASSLNFTTKVITMTPQLLKDNMGLIEEADLISIHTSEGVNVLKKLYHFSRTEGDQAMQDAYYTYYPMTKFDYNNDLTNEEVIAIARRMASDNPAALFMEQTNMMHNPRTNVCKLIYMTMQYKPSDFQKLGFLDQVEKDSQGKEKLYYSLAKDEGGNPSESLATEWGRDTFLYDPNGVNQKDKMRFYSCVSAGNNVMDKILTYNGNQSGFMHLLSKKEDISHATDFNYAQDDLHKYYGRDNNLTILDAFKFVLQQPQYTPKLRILEVQPCDQFIYQPNNDSWHAYYQALFPWYHPRTDEESWLEDNELISITTMTVAEFVGTTGQYDYNAKDAEGYRVLLNTESSDDLIAKYDLIIFGSKQDKTNGLNGYNDKNLGNLLYTAIGDLAVGASDADVNKALKAEEKRYSANDITLKKMLELEDFLRAGKSIVVDDGLYTSDQSAIDKTKVDPNSKLYDLLTWSSGDAATPENNIFRHDNIADRGSDMRKLINGNQCRLEFIDTDQYTYPTEYGYTSDNETISYTGGNYTAGGVIDSEIYHTDKDDKGNAILTYHFYIQGKSIKGYQIALHVDSNGDGVYGSSLKERSEVDNMNAVMGKHGDDVYTYDTSEQAVALNIYTSKAAMKRGTSIGKSDEEGFYLQAGTEYYATAIIPPDRQGIIPWKLEVNDADNAKLRSSAIDYTAVYSSDNVEQLNVLQMCVNADMTDALITKSYYDDDVFSSFTLKSVSRWGKNYYDPNQDYTLEDASYNPLYDKIKGNNNKVLTAKKFETYLEPVKEFKVNIQYLTCSDWMIMFGDGAKGTDGVTTLTTEQNLANWNDFLSQYDMLVFGFVDACGYTKNTTFMSGMKEFSDQGKSIILSHDMMSPSIFTYNTSDKSYQSATSPWLRTLAGQRKSYYNSAGDGTYVKSYDGTTYGTGNVTLSEEDIRSKLLTSDPNKASHDYVLASEVGVDTDKDIYLNEASDNSAQLFCFNKNVYSIKDRNSSEASGWQDSDRTTNFVKLANNGQITTYPYKLNDVIEVHPTHAQHFQLDMEFMDTGDVNVWYNLTDANDPDVKANSTLYSKSVNNSVNLYSTKDQDSRNNFFIYTKGNITYTGSGHGVGLGDYGSSIMTDDEVKLFVNTMISAYRQPDSKPYVSVDNADAVATSGENLLYVDYDQNNSNLSLDGKIVEIDGQKMVMVELSVHDLKDAGVTDGAIENKQYFLNVKPADDKLDQKELSLVNDPDQPDNKLLGSSGTEWYEVDAAKEGSSYLLYVPYEKVQGNNSVEVVLTTYAKYKKNGRTVKTSRKSALADITILPMFDLN